MSVQGLGDAIASRGKPLLDEVDARYFIERLLRREWGVQSVVCVSVSNQVIHLRGKSSAERQTILLAERDICRATKVELDIEVDGVKVTL